MAHTFTSLRVHVIYSTKDRCPHIDDELRPRLFAYMGGVIRDVGAVPMIVNGTADHTHQLIGVPAARSVAELVRLVKSNTSKWVHETFPAKTSFAWQTQEEYVAFLRRHGIAYDERFVWD